MTLQQPGERSICVGSWPLYEPAVKFTGGDVIIAGMVVLVGEDVVVVLADVLVIGGIALVVVVRFATVFVADGAPVFRPAKKEPSPMPTTTTTRPTMKRVRRSALRLRVKIGSFSPGAKPAALPMHDVRRNQSNDQSGDGHTLLSWSWRHRNMLVHQDRDRNVDCLPLTVSSCPAPCWGKENG